jgi:hypothetical protein
MWAVAAGGAIAAVMYVVIVLVMPTDWPRHRRVGMSRAEGWAHAVYAVVHLEGTYQAWGIAIRRTTDAERSSGDWWVVLPGPTDRGWSTFYCADNQLISELIRWWHTRWARLLREHGATVSPGVGGRP